MDPSGVRHVTIMMGENMKDSGLRTFVALTLVFVAVPFTAMADLITGRTGSIGQNEVCLSAVPHANVADRTKGLNVIAGSQCDGSTAGTDWSAEPATTGSVIKTIISSKEWCLDLDEKVRAGPGGGVNVVATECKGTGNRIWNLEDGQYLYSMLSGRKAFVAAGSQGVTANAVTIGGKYDAWTTGLRFGWPKLNGLAGAVQPDDSVIYVARTQGNQRLIIQQPASGGTKLIEQIRDSVNSPWRNAPTPKLPIPTEGIFGVVMESGVFQFPLAPGKTIHDSSINGKTAFRGFLLNSNGTLVVELSDGKTTRLLDDYAIRTKPRDIHFLAIADPQYENNPQDNVERTKEREDSNAAMASINQLISGLDGIVVAGDLTQWSRRDEFQAYQAARGNNLAKYYDGVGNHDLTAGECCNGVGAGAFCTCAGEILRDLNRKRNGQISQIPEPYCSQGYDQTECSTPPKPFYSWKFDDVLFVNLGLYGGGSRVKTGEAILSAWNSLDFLKTQLDNHEGPAILVQHYCFNPSVQLCGSSWWTDDEKRALWETIAGQEVLAIIVGHWHNPADSRVHETWTRPATVATGRASVPIINAARIADGNYVNITIDDNALIATRRDALNNHQDRHCMKLDLTASPQSSWSVCP